MTLDEDAGRIKVEAGVGLANLSKFLRTRGFAVPVVPGTAQVSVGGMVAADIHGKNHHVAGTLGRHITSIDLVTADGDLVTASREANADLFRATLGGMGLFGHIVNVEIELEKIDAPWIFAEHRRVVDLDDLIGTLRETGKQWPMTVTWCDMAAKGGQRGRGELVLGRWATPEECGGASPAAQLGIEVPFLCPEFLINSLVLTNFNRLKFAMTPTSPVQGIEHPDTFFHPLDRLQEWNRLYGKRGMTQLQCLLPHDDSHRLYHRFFDLLERTGQLAALAVIKDCGAAGDGLLSFPKPGMTFALDFAVDSRRTPRAVDRLGEFIAAEGGRIYLAKDAFMPARHFRAMEGERYDAFLAARERFDPQHRIDSAQAQRLFGKRS